MRRKKRFLVGGIIVFLAIGYLGWMGFQSSAMYYYTVSEVIGQGNAVYDENLRVKGEVAPDSIEQEATGRLLNFIIVE
ncbi:MAG: cytochrome c maturation protein CcmE, partial [Dehalococcoidales bacterium]|nr:cytochrome c maturation protein CcmE [Dehalococcoidales bacterium]